MTHLAEKWPFWVTFFKQRRLLVTFFTLRPLFGRFWSLFKFWSLLVASGRFLVAFGRFWSLFGRFWVASGHLLGFMSLLHKKGGPTFLFERNNILHSNHYLLRKGFAADAKTTCERVHGIDLHENRTSKIQLEVLCREVITVYKLIACI